MLRNAGIAALALGAGATEVVSQDVPGCLVQSGSTTIEVPESCFGNMVEVGIATNRYGQDLENAVSILVDHNRESGINDFSLSVQRNTGNFALVTRDESQASDVQVGIYDSHESSYDIYTVDLSEAVEANVTEVESARGFVWGANEQIFAFTYVFRTPEGHAKSGAAAVMLGEQYVTTVRFNIPDGNYVARIDTIPEQVEGQDINTFYLTIQEPNGDTFVSVQRFAFGERPLEDPAPLEGARA